MIDSYNQLAPNQTQPRWDRIVRKDTPFFGQVALGNMTAFTMSLIILERPPHPPSGVVFPCLLVNISGKGSYTFSHYVHWSYAAEKLNLTQPDAKAVADLINSNLPEPIEYKEQAAYANLDS